MRAVVRVWARSGTNHEASLTTYLLPGDKVVHLGEFTPEPAWKRRTANGRDAYPGGWPGEGGKGGTVTSVLASAAVEPGICDVAAGDHGDPTMPVAATMPPDPYPAYDMWIEIVQRTHPSDPIPKRPAVTLRDVSGQKGLSAPGQRYERNGKPGDRFYEDAKGVRITDPSVLASLPTVTAVKVYPPKHGGRNADQKPNNLQKSDDLSWLRPAALAATVRYARMAYRNGFTELASSAIEPYCRLLLDRPKADWSVDPDVRLALTAIQSMKNNLDL